MDPDYREMLFQEGANQRKLIKLRAALVLWLIFVIGWFLPGFWLVALGVPIYLARYRRRLADPGRGAMMLRAAGASAALYRSSW